MDLLSSLCTKEIMNSSTSAPSSSVTSSSATPENSSNVLFSSRLSNIENLFSEEEDDVESFQAEEEETISLHEEDDTAKSYESIFACNDNSIHMLFAMACGIKDENESYIADYESDQLFIKSKKKKFFKPSKLHLIEEVKRRKMRKGESPKLSTQKTVPFYTDWLKENNTLDQEDSIWVKTKISWFRRTLADASESTFEDVDQHLTFRGNTWVLRVVHALVDHDDAKLAFASSYDVEDRLSVDSRNSPGHIKKTVYDIVAGYYNNPDFNPMSTLYPHVHSDFAEVIDLVAQTRIDKTFLVTMPLRYFTFGKKWMKLTCTIL
mmetsp:Transcript_13664/g.16599  ORF Transcript_13664/g.16599 Transcript_13664/m.16599 type:complete len:321 (+) Transcript_13664:1406-2368(+)